ncbi:MAG TPA: FAD-dependent oxidoreductase, partial [Acetobacteraceae bacterium]
PGPAGFVGLIGGTAEWVFVKDDHVSVTISAANRLLDTPAETLVAAVWPEVRAALDLGGIPMPPWRVVKERRATFAATAAQERRRPGPRVGLANLALAGDWTATGLPATIEGAIRSGRRAAQVILVA